MFNGFNENDEWDECLRAVDAWDEEQDLIAKSNLVQDEDAPRPEHLEVLARCFGHKKFRPMQWKIINSIINDKRDNCAIMATGYGKSLCFQYPAVYVGGITIVISPLISLMEDQILSLTMSSIPACLLGSAQTEKKQTVEDIFAGRYNLIYITPEFACGDYGQDLLRRMNSELAIILLAIDEAHCVSSWGHDFRYQYRQLGQLRGVLPHVPILAVTATATPKVRSDIVSTLNLRNAQVLCSGFDRPNLQFSVHLKGSNGVLNDLRGVMAERNGVYSFPGSAIIYCITRKQTEEIAKQLKLNGIKCAPYHAGMTSKARKETHEKFVKDKVPIIVATIAFGMGIDKPDVRYVIHYGSSKDIESYYQEVGRAGRDGQPSFCITFYNSGDFDLHQTIRELHHTSETNRARRNAMEKIMIQYLETRDCRRQFILNHFEGTITPKKPKLRCCDNCTRKLRETTSDSNKYEGLNEKGLYDFAKDAQVFLGAVDAMNGKFGFGMYILFIRGSKSSKLHTKLLKHSLYGSGKYQTDEWWKAVARVMEREGYLKKIIKNNGRGKSIYNIYNISDKGSTFLRNPKGIKILLQPTPEMFKLLKRKHQPNSPEESQFKSKQSLPSTSGKVKATSRPSLKLLKLPSPVKSTKPATTSKVTNYENDASETEVDSNESSFEKQERMTVYRLLMNKRTEIASTNDCMPYMIASNEALMKMAQVKPLTIKELRDSQLEGFTEAKIKRFGEEFLKTLRVICNIKSTAVENTKKCIQDILAENPLPGVNISASAEATYSIYKSGLTVQEIATKRGVVAGTIFSHLADAIKVGYPVKMIDLGITDEMRETILNVIRKPPVNSDISNLTSIKNECPPEITYDIVRIVVSYIQVREHLENLKAAYQEFEDFTYVANVSSQSKRKESDSAVSSSSDENEKKKIKLGSPLSLSVRKYEPNEPQNKKPKSSENLNLSDVVPSSTLQGSNDTTLDLEPTLLDDFFDDDDLSADNVQEITKDQSKPKSINPENSETDQNSASKDIEVVKIPSQTSSNSQTENIAPNKLKKFQFKSKVPLSVEKSTHKLYTNQQK